MQDEYLTSVSGYVKHDCSEIPCVSQLTFTTSLGNTYGPYGGGGGTFFEVNVEYDEIKGFFGHATTEYLTAFGGSYQIKTAAHAPGWGVRKCPCKTESRWSMEPADKIIGISVGAASCVNSIKITFVIDGTCRVTPRYGGPGVAKGIIALIASQFKLMPDEYLTSVSGYVKYECLEFPCVSQLTFTTNHGETYGPYGGGGGDFFEVNVEYDEIKGFFGQANADYLTAFGVCVKLA
ncbi:unnamed protein product [Musa textilis]